MKDKFGQVPDWMIANTAYGTGPMPGWGAQNDYYILLEGHLLKQFRRNYSDPNRAPRGKGIAKNRALKLT